MKNKKLGFTLIELLAVIIILAIVALIATPIILDVIDELNCPILVTSANQKRKKTALTSDDVYEQLPKIDGIVLGTCKALQASTIVDCTKEKLQILRPGPISLEELESLL